MARAAFGATWRLPEGRVIVFFFFNKTNLLKKRKEKKDWRKKKSAGSSPSFPSASSVFGWLSHGVGRAASVERSGRQELDVDA